MWLLSVFIFFLFFGYGLCPWLVPLLNTCPVALATRHKFHPFSSFTHPISFSIPLIYLYQNRSILPLTKSSNTQQYDLEIVEQYLMMVELLTERNIKSGLPVVTTDGPPPPIFRNFFFKLLSNR